MNKIRSTSKYVKFLVYVVAVVLLNAVSATLFFRIDLTGNKVYSLSETSRAAVAGLSEPLTVKAFFTDDLPAPYNNIERYLRDLLDEYSVAGNRYFNYAFYNLSAKEGDEKDSNKELAQGYGIRPLQIQNIERDEVKFQKAYMGLVMIHGDLVETIPSITSTEGLEYTITSRLQKMTSKISALLRLQEPVQALLFLSSSLQVVGPYMNLPGLDELPERVQGIIETLNDRLYGKLAFRHLDPTQDPDSAAEAQHYRLLKLRWDDFRDRRGESISAGSGVAGLVIRHGDKTEEIRLIRVTRLPIFGTQYQLTPTDKLEKAIEEAVENVIDVNEEIGYLVSNGCPDLSGAAMPGKPDAGALTHFNALLGEDYTIRPVNLEKESIPDGLSTLIIAGPRERFTDYELYQIDQFLMKGRSILLFLDVFNEIRPQQDPRMFRPNQQPVYVPTNTGLEKLLAHMGVSLEKAYVLDESCFRQRIPQQFGGGERPIYFAPLIKQEEIDTDLPILKNIKGLVVLKTSPVRVDEAKLEEDGLKAIRLISSSDDSWEMRGRIDLNPLMLRPPGPDADRGSVPLAYLVEGPFPSYFAGREIPEKEKPEGKAEGAEETPPEGLDTSAIESGAVTIEKGKPGRLFVVGTSEILKDNVIDQKGRGPNAQFVLNIIDDLSGREAMAVMRSKGQTFNPLEDVEPGTRTLIKSFNIAGLPVLVVLAGLVVWLRRMSRKRTIQNMFRA